MDNFSDVKYCYRLSQARYAHVTDRHRLSEVKIISGDMPHETDFKLILLQITPSSLLFASHIDTDCCGFS